MLVRSNTGLRYNAKPGDLNISLPRIFELNLK